MRYIIDEYAHDAPPLVRDFLVYMTTIRGKSPKTSFEYFLDLRLFLRFLKIQRGLVPRSAEFDEIPICDVDADLLRSVTLRDVYDFLTYIGEQRPTQQNSPATEYGLSAVSRARKVSSLRSFFKYLTDKVNVLDANPVAGLELPSKRKELPRYLTADDSMQLLESVDGPFAERDYCILTLFLNCGMRVSELTGLNLTDIQEGTIRVRGKGNKERILYLNEACQDALVRYLPTRLQPHEADRNALFVSRNRNRINAQTVKWLVKKYITAAGLDPTKYSAHKLRHTAATLMYQNGVDIRTLQNVLGHARVDTTMIYTHIADQNVRDAAERNPLAHVTRGRKRTDDTPDDA